MSLFGSAAGSMVDASFGIYSANKAYTRQKEMMKNAHTWEVEDLRRAGLNPILSATGGNGAGSFNAPVSEGGNFSSALGADADRKIQRDLANSTKDVNASVIDRNFYEGGLANQRRATENAVTANQLWVNEHILPLQKEEVMERIRNIKADSETKITNSLSTAIMAKAAADQVGVGQRRNEIDAGRVSTPLISGNLGELMRILFGGANDNNTSSANAYGTKGGGD